MPFAENLPSLAFLAQCFEKKKKGKTDLVDKDEAESDFGNENGDLSSFQRAQFFRNLPMNFLYSNKNHALSYLWL